MLREKYMYLFLVDLFNFISGRHRDVEKIYNYVLIMYNNYV